MAPKDDDKTVTLPVPWAPGTTVTGPEAHLRRWLDRTQEQRAARTQWPEDGALAMTALARLFPTLTRHDSGMVPGCSPWDAEKLVQWLNTSSEPTSGSRHAALFLLSVWNADDWTVHGLKVRKLGKDDWKGARRIGRFDFNDAWASWDDRHRAAALAWLTNPFWP